jgi:hypothetical protein
MGVAVVKLKEALQLDLRVKGNKELLVEMLVSLPFFKDEPAMEDLEVVLGKVQRKYPVSLAYIMRGPAQDDYYSFMIKRSDTNDWIYTVYARSMYEGFAKTILIMYEYIKKNLKKG